MKIRKATEKDIPQIDQIYIEGSFDEEKLNNSKLNKEDFFDRLKEYKAARLKNFRKCLKSPEQFWVVAEEEKEILGFGQIIIINKFQAELEKIYISKKFRGKGISKILASELFDWAKRKKVERVFSRILLNNKPSINLHKGLDFKLTAVRMDKILR